MWHGRSPVRFSMSPWESFFSSRNSRKRSTIIIRAFFRSYDCKISGTQEQSIRAPAFLQEMPNTPDVIQALRIFMASILPPQGAWLHPQLGLRSPLPADRKNGVPRILNSGGELPTGNPRPFRTSRKYTRLGVRRNPRRRGFRSLAASQYGTLRESFYRPCHFGKARPC